MAIAIDRPGSASVDWLTVPPAIVEQERSPVSIKSTGAALPQWWETVKPRLLELGELRPGWEGHHAQALSVIDLADALKFLARVMTDATKAPWIGPLNSGGLELVWEEDGLEIEAVFDHVRGDRQLLVTDGDSDFEISIDQADSVFLALSPRLRVLTTAT